MTSKQRAYLKGLAMNLEPIFQIGKSSLTPEVTEAIGEAFNTKELIKITVLKNCMDDPNEIARMLAERTHAQVVQVIGKKIVTAKKTRQLAVSGLAKGMKLQNDAKAAFQNMKDEAQDICCDAKEQAGINDTDACEEADA